MYFLCIINFLFPCWACPPCLKSSVFWYRALSGGSCSVDRNNDDRNNDNNTVISNLLALYIIKMGIYP